MNTTIWKYPFHIHDDVQLEVQEGAKILTTAAIGRHRLAVWALVDPDAKQVPLHLRIIGTGSPIPDLPELSYIGTAWDTPFVWHIFHNLDKTNYYEALDNLRGELGFSFTHNPGGGEFYRGDLRCQIGMQDYQEDYNRFVEWLKENGIE